MPRQKDNEWAATMLSLAFVLVVVPAAMHAQTRLAIPSYVEPNSSAWRIWQAPGGRAVGLMVLNLNNGDEKKRDEGAVSAIEEAHKNGVSVVFYTHTKNGKRPLEEVKDRIDAAYGSYALDGVFLDEGLESCSGPIPGGAGATEEQYYAALSDFIRSKPGKHLVVLNPAIIPNEACWMRYADIFVDYVNGGIDAYEKQYSDFSWTHHYSADRFWHIIHSATCDQAKDPACTEHLIDRVLELAKQRNAAWVYLTDDGADGNAFDQVPSYFAATVKAISPAASDKLSRTLDELKPITIRFAWPKSISRKLQIQIDADRNWKTGYKGNKIGAEYLLQVSNGSCSVNKYKGSGFDWEWTMAGSCQMTSANGGALLVAIFNPKDFGITQDFDYEVQTLNPDWSVSEDTRPAIMRLDHSPIDQMILVKK
jgi:Spherulation-specific family 4